MEKSQSLNDLFKERKEKDVLLLRNHLETGGKSKLKTRAKNDLNIKDSKLFPPLPEHIIEKIFNMAEYWCVDIIKINGNKTETDFLNIALWNLLSIIYRFFTNLFENVGVSVDFLPTLDEGNFYYV